MVTAEITDEQIEAIRLRSSEEGVGIYTDDHQFEVAEVLNLCDEALGDFDYGDRLKDMPPEWFAMRKRDARAICAEILNARAAKEQR
jgi:hypothetical protein